MRKGDTISEIHWSGGAIPPEQYGTFRFLVRNPVETGEITWPIVQRYEDGEVQRWIGPADSDEPASVTQISESATPEDIIAVNGEKLAEAGSAKPAATAAPAAAATAEEDDGEDALDWVTLGLAAGGFVLGGLAFLRRRPHEAARRACSCSLVAPGRARPQGQPELPLGDRRAAAGASRACGWR